MDEAMAAAAATLSPEQQARYVLYPYLDGAAMADCPAAADLALCRSGASTLGELPVTATPAVLVPFPILLYISRRTPSIWPITAPPSWWPTPNYRSV
jgi:hypothetical protein